MQKVSKIKVEKSFRKLVQFFCLFCLINFVYAWHHVKFHFISEFNFGCKFIYEYIFEDDTFEYRNCGILSEAQGWEISVLTEIDWEASRNESHIADHLTVLISIFWENEPDWLWKNSIF